MREPAERFPQKVTNTPTPTPGAGGSTTTRTIIYDYDALQRLTSAIETGATSNSYGYTYDLVGNRLTSTINGSTTTRSYNAANRVIGWTYDNAGNLTSDGTNSYGYDPLNRLISLTAGGQTRTSAYNGDGTLVSQTFNSVTTRYTQDLASPLSQILGDGTNTYIYGMDRLYGIAGSTRSWYVADPLGSVRATLSDTGVVGGVANYDPYGQVQSGSVGSFGFTGELQQGSSVYLRARWYNATSGSFGSRDPFEGQFTSPESLLFYAYAGNDPVNYTDPSGEYRCKNTPSGRGHGRAYGSGYTYGDFCSSSAAIADVWVQSSAETHSLGVLISLFSANGFPGGSSPKALKYRQHDLSPAAERLEFILDYTASTVEPAQFGKQEFTSTGFNAQYQDPWPDSNNQVGHFLTAVGFGYDSQHYVRDFRTALGLAGTSPNIENISDEGIALRLMLGHEKWPDRAGSNLSGYRIPVVGGLPAARAQYEAATQSDIDAFYLAIKADQLGYTGHRDCLLESILGFPASTPPKNRNGNSLQDLRLSLKGWRLGVMIRQGRIQSIDQAATWLYKNLR